MLERCGAVIDYLSVHHYSRLHDLDEVYDAAGHIAEGRAFEGVLRNVADAIRARTARSTSRLALDEWGWAGGRQGLAGAAFTACVLTPARASRRTSRSGRTAASSTPAPSSSGSVSS